MVEFGVRTFARHCELGVMDLRRVSMDGVGNANADDIV